MISTEDKKLILILIEEACKAGARQCKACEMIGISERTLQRWQKRTTVDDIADKRPYVQRSPANKLSKEEKQTILATCNSQEYGSLPPSQIVPRLCDQGVYVASEASFYRILRENGLQNHRGKSQYKTKRKPRGYTATGPNQVWTWDITHLPTVIRGSFYYLYMITDIYSRKIVGWEVHDRQSDELASELVKRACLAEGISGEDVVLHSDNGSPMKGATMLCTLQQLGVIPSFSRPSVSNDNPYSEALFKTLKYIPSYPSSPFESLDASREWVLNFVRWYNNEHRHSAIKFVTPNERHTGVDKAILDDRQKVYLKAKARKPERWSRGVRDWTVVTEVSLNPEKNDRRSAT